MDLKPGSIYPPEPSMPPSWSMLVIFGFEFAWRVAAISGVHPTLFALMFRQGEGVRTRASVVFWQGQGEGEGEGEVPHLDILSKDFA